MGSDAPSFLPGYPTWAARGARTHGVLDVLGPQLIKGRQVRLTRAKKEALECCSVKYILINQLTHAAERRFAIPDEDYWRFHSERTPDGMMQLWAGYTEPPGQHGGPQLAFVDFSLNEPFHDPQMLERSGLSPDLASKDYCAIFRFGNCIVSL